MCIQELMERGLPLFQCRDSATLGNLTTAMAIDLNWDFDRSRYTTWRDQETCGRMLQWRLSLSKVRLVRGKGRACPKLLVQYHVTFLSFVETDVALLKGWHGVSQSKLSTQAALGRAHTRVRLKTSMRGRTPVGPDPSSLEASRFRSYTLPCRANCGNTSGIPGSSVAAEYSDVVPCCGWCVTSQAPWP